MLTDLYYYYFYYYYYYNYYYYYYYYYLGLVGPLKSIASWQEFSILVYYYYYYCYYYYYLLIDTTLKLLLLFNWPEFYCKWEVRKCGIIIRNIMLIEFIIYLSSVLTVFLCLVLVEPKALCYRAYMCIRNHPSFNTSEPKEVKVSHGNTKTLMFWSTKSRIMTQKLKVEWEHLFRTILKWFRQKKWSQQATNDTKTKTETSLSDKLIIIVPSAHSPRHYVVVHT